MGLNKVDVELGKHIAYEELDMGDIVTVGSDNIYIVAHASNLEFQLINIRTGNSRYDNTYLLDELAKTLKEENSYRKVRLFKNSTMQLKLGKEYMPLT